VILQADELKSVILAPTFVATRFLQQVPHQRPTKRQTSWTSVSWKLALAFAWGGKGHFCMNEQHLMGLIDTQLQRQSTRALSAGISLRWFGG